MKYYNSNSKFLVQRSSKKGPSVQKYMNFDDFLPETLIPQFKQDVSRSRCCSTLTFKPILVGPHSTACGEKKGGNKRVKMATVKVRTKEETPVPPQQCAGGIGPPA